MEPARWERIKSVFQEAFARDPADRDAWLDAACGADADLRGAVQRLLDGHAGAGTFLETPLVAPPIPPAEDPLLGHIVGPYRIEAPIAAGGMGEVYRAHDAKFDRAVALKLLPAAVAADPERLRRFHAEARAASSLNHPHILVIHDSGDVDGRPFIVTELVEGETLRQRLRAGPLPVREALDVAVQVASALSAAHARGLVHRDVKPENVMIRSDGYVKLLDFGLAKPVVGGAPAEAALQTMAGVVLGTPRYMSPEQALGQPVDGRSDVFSCGAMLYEMVAGRAAFEGATTAAIFDAVLHRSPPPAHTVNPSVPAALAQVIDRALAKAPAARHQGAGELHAELNRLRSDTGAAASPGRARRRPLWPAAAAVAVLVALAAWAVVNGRRDAGPSPPGAGESATRLVVLPFENLTGQSGDDWLASGFSDSLTFGLQNVGDLVLVNRERISELYRSEGVREAGALDPQVIRRLSGQLGVRYYVHGSYQRVGDTIKVVSRLVEAASGEIKAQESVTDRFANVLQVEDELARRFAASFAAGVAPRPVPPPRSVEAYEAMTEARGFYADSQHARAIPLLERAVALDPQYAEAWALLSKAHSRTTSQATFEAASIAAAHNTAMMAAERAVALAPDFFDGHAALALASRETGRLADWRREARRAIELAPRVAEPYMLLADSYSAGPNFGCSRDRDAAIAADYYRRAIAIDPRDSSAYSNLAYHFHWHEDIDGAIRIADEGFARLPGNHVLRRRQVLKPLLLGRPGEAEAAFPQYIPRALTPSDRMLLGTIRAAQHRWAEAAAMFDDGIREAPLSANGLWAARHFALYGNGDGAATYLQRAVSMEPACAAFIAQAPVFTPLQAHPAVRALVTDAASASPVRLVVLPFENLTGREADDWLAGAFSDSLTTGLRDLDSVILVSRDRLVELYRQERLKEAAAIDAGALGRVARALGVPQVVHGSYQRWGGNIRVTARLIATGTGAILAQESVTAPIAALLRVEDDLARRFAARLHGRQPPSAQGVATTSLEAYRAFIDGRTRYAEGRFVDAVAPLTRATALDPNYAHAWAVLAKVHARRAALSTIASGDADALRRDALAAARRAATLRPDLYDAHAALALAFREVGNVDGWRDAAQKAIDLNPRIAEAYELLADSHFAGNAWGCGRDRHPQMAEENFRRSIALDPRSAPSHANFSYHYSWLGREADALRTAEEGLALLPGNPIVTRARALALIRLNRLEEAEGALRTMLAAGAMVSGQDHLMFGMIALARRDLALARREFDTAIARLPTSAFHLAVARAFFDHAHMPEGAAALDRAIALEPACAAFIAHSPVFKSSQAHPAVRALLTRR